MSNPPVSKSTRVRKFLFPLAAVLLLLLTISLSAASHQSGLNNTNTPKGYSSAQFFIANQLQRTPTLRPTPTPTPTRPPPNLNLQLVFALGGGGLYCSSIVSPDMGLPAVAYERFSEGGGQDRVCIYGFRPGETVQVKIYDPSGRQVYTVSQYIQDRDEFGYGFPVNHVDLSPLPNNAPAGEWRVVAEGPGSRAENRYYHPDGYNQLTVNKAVSRQAPWFDPRRLPIFFQGNNLHLQGVKFPSNKDLTVALYRLGEGRNLISGQTVRTNRSGAFEAGFGITRDFVPGDYFAVLVENPDQGTYTLDDTLVHFLVRQTTQPCSGAMPSQLKKDSTAMLSAGSPNNVREKPGLSSRQVGKIFEYEQLDILAGPKCADGLAWWKVYSTNTGLDGWTAEGKNGDYWLIPSGY